MNRDKEIKTSYEPKEVEEKWYKFWEKKGYFTPDVNSEKPPFSMVIPPPNITGSLHMGHALNNTLQDVVARYKRMKGYNVLWLPGTDHAGIATQNVVEREISKEGLTRHTLGREEFIKKVWEWKTQYGGRIIFQLKKLGASCDWTRERFTMDENLSEAVREAFYRLYRKGLIYRGDYIINWCPRCETALADIEVEQEETNGFLYYIRYPVKDEDGHIVVATTRPETMLGDTAVAVHPDDERYVEYHGKTIILPLSKREIPVIPDPYVEMDFGTGALKITPAHDFYDFEIGKKHNLPVVKVIDEKGRMTEEAGHYKGLDRFEARKRVIKDLKEGGLLEKQTPYTVLLGRCYRCKTVVEPLISNQWFIKMKSLAEEAIKAVRGKETVIIPEGWEKSYYSWLENIRDWCVSRQIWWGHRIPAYYCLNCGEIIVKKSPPIKCQKCKSSRLKQDEDVLDTWFSSALWPFSTLGWPKKTREIELFYPTSLLVTAFDILFFWVARMMMMGLFFMKKVPFRRVYIHALIRDEKGQKMSKTRGNVIDPVEMMEKYGTDALRFTLTALTVQGRDIKLSESRIEGYKHFINKIWNASRFILMQKIESEDEITPATLEDRWILTLLSHLINDINEGFENYEFSRISLSLYQFFWGEFCDWYIESAKYYLYGNVSEELKRRKITLLYYILEKFLRLAHPIIPFITEEIWHKIPENLRKQNGGRESIMISDYPSKTIVQDDTSVELFEKLKNITTTIRGVKNDYNIAERKEVKCRLWTDENIYDVTREYVYIIKHLAGTGDIEVEKGKSPGATKETVVRMADNCEVEVWIKGLINIDVELEKAERDEEKVNEKYRVLMNKLSNENFVHKAPKDIVQKTEEEARIYAEKVKLIKEKITNLRRMKES